MTDAPYTPTYTPTPEDTVNQTFSDLLNLLAVAEDQYQRMQQVEDDVMINLNRNYNKLKSMCNRQVGDLPNMNIYQIQDSINNVHTLLKKLNRVGFFKVGKMKANPT